MRRRFSCLLLEEKVSRPIPREAVTDEVSPLPLVRAWSQAVRFPPHPSSGLRETPDAAFPSRGRHYAATKVPFCHCETMLTLVCNDKLGAWVPWFSCSCRVQGRTFISSRATVRMCGRQRNEMKNSASKNVRLLPVEPALECAGDNVMNRTRVHRGNVQPNT